MSHSAPFFISLSLVASKSPESTRRSRILQTDGFILTVKPFVGLSKLNTGHMTKKN